MHKEYTKPLVKRVNLIPTEAKLAACKVYETLEEGSNGYASCCNASGGAGGCFVPAS